MERRAEVVRVGLSLSQLWNKVASFPYNCPGIPVFCVNGLHARPLSLLYKESSANEINAFCLNSDAEAIPQKSGGKTSDTLREALPDVQKVKVEPGMSKLPSGGVTLLPMQKEALKQKERDETVSILSRASEFLDQKKVPNPIGHAHQIAAVHAEAMVHVKGVLSKDNAYALAQAVTPKKKLQANRTLTETMGSRWVEVVEHEPEKFWSATAQALSTEDLVSELLRRSMHHPQVQSFFDASLPWFQAVRIGDGTHVHVQQVVKGPDSEAYRVVDLSPDVIYASPCHRVAPPKAFKPKNLTRWS